MAISLESAEIRRLPKIATGIGHDGFDLKRGNRGGVTQWHGNHGMEKEHTTRVTDPS